MKTLHQPPPELRQAEAMPPEKRRRKRNAYRRYGQGDHTVTTRDLKEWAAHRASSKMTSTVLPEAVS